MIGFERRRFQRLARVFRDGSNADAFAEPLARPEELIVPVVTIFEVFKRVLQQRDETAAIQAVALMEQGRVVPLDGVRFFPKGKR